MKDLQYLGKYRVHSPFTEGKSKRKNGAFRIKLKSEEFVDVVAGIEDEWEHVSVSTEYRCLTWDEMCEIKDLFFEEEECVIQFHPPKSEYVNFHSYCLHMWRPTNGIIMRPKS